MAALSEQAKDSLSLTTIARLSPSLSVSLCRGGFRSLSDVTKPYFSEKRSRHPQSVRRRRRALSFLGISLRTSCQGCALHPSRLSSYQVLFDTLDVHFDT